MYTKLTWDNFPLSRITLFPVTGDRSSCMIGNGNICEDDSWSGHRLPGQDRSYLRLSEEDRFIEYRKAVDFLTVSTESKLRQQIANKENDVKFIYEEISSMKRCINHMIVMMQKEGYDTQEMESQYDEYTHKVTKTVDSNLT